MYIVGNVEGGRDSGRSISEHTALDREPSATEDSLALPEVVSGSAAPLFSSNCLRGLPLLPKRKDRLKSSHLLHGPGERGCKAGAHAVV